MNQISPDDFEEAIKIFEGFQKIIEENNLDNLGKVKASACLFILYWNELKRTEERCVCHDCLISFVLNIKTMLDEIQENSK